VPAGVDALIKAGHTVYLQKGAGEESHFSDDEYKTLGAKIVYSTEEVFQRSEIIVKVARITEEESEYLQENQILFSFLQLVVSEKKVLSNLLAKKVTAIGYELIDAVQSISANIAEGYCRKSINEYLYFLNVA